MFVHLHVVKIFLFLLLLWHLILILLNYGQKTCTVCVFLEYTKILFVTQFLQNKWTLKITINYISQIQWDFFFCLFIYLFLACESLVTKKSVLKSPFSLSFQIVYPFISCNFYFICCDAILLSEGQRKHVFVMNFIPQHYHAFLLESGLSDINISNPAFSFFATCVSSALLLFSKFIPKSIVFNPMCTDFYNSHVPLWFCNPIHVF